MRYGCCVNMVTQTRDVSGTDVVPVLKKLGYDYAELSLSHLCALSDEAFDKVSHQLLSFGFPLEACNNFFPPGLRLTGAETDGNAIRLYLDRAFQRASVLGVKVIVFGSGGARMVPEGYPSSGALWQLIDLLKLLQGYCQETGITIAIEPLRKQECNMVNTYREALVLAQLADVPKVNCLLDFYHLVEENEALQVIYTDTNRLAHVHFCEPMGRVFPSAGNAALYRNWLTSLSNIGYDHRISIEAYSHNFETDAAEALDLLRNIENDLIKS